MIKIAQGAVEQDAVIYTLTRFGLSKVANAMVGGAIGTALGAVGGYMSADENSSGWERAGRAALGAKVLGTVGGLGGHYVANRGAAAQVAGKGPQLAHGAPQVPHGAPGEFSMINDTHLSPEVPKPAQVGGAAPMVAQSTATPPQGHYANADDMLKSQGRLSKSNQSLLRVAFDNNHVPNTEDAWSHAPRLIMATPQQRAAHLKNADPSGWQHTYLSNYPGT